MGRYFRNAWKDLSDGLEQTVEHMECGAVYSCGESGSDGLYLLPQLWVYVRFNTNPVLLPLD